MLPPVWFALNLATTLARWCWLCAWLTRWLTLRSNCLESFMWSSVHTVRVAVQSVAGREHDGGIPDPVRLDCVRYLSLPSASSRLAFFTVPPVAWRVLKLRFGSTLKTMSKVKRC